MRGEVDMAAAATLFADPARARILLALADGRSLAASVLAAEAGLSASATSAHLAKLREGGLITMERSGRHRYHRLAGEQVATAIEALAVLAPAQPIRSLRQHTRTTLGVDLAALTAAPSSRSLLRFCLDWSEQRHHLAGRLGAAVLAAMLDHRWVTRSSRGRGLDLTTAGAHQLQLHLGLGTD
ncbi:MAG TPA: metalloregulator ArsR/SmtB family transcription factor [Pseudonocardiaceae bacterium]